MSAILLTSDALVTAAAGLTEFDGKSLFFTPMGTQRGIVPAKQTFRLNADLAGANATTAQNIFGVGVSLSASTVYQFEALVALQKTAGTTSHTISFGFGGTATLNNIGYLVTGWQPSAYTGNLTAAANLNYIQTAAATVNTQALTSATQSYLALIKGSVSVNAAGTFIPQYTLSAAPGGAYSTAVNSYISIFPIGTSGANTSVGTWA